MIIIPSKRIIEPKSELVLPSFVSGRYRMTANNRRGKTRVVADWFDNLITDNGLNQLGTLGHSTYASYCRVGSGSTAPANSNTSLVSQIASTSTTQSTVSGAAASSPYYGYVQLTKRFAEGVATGNLSEVGMGATASGADLFSRALILDGGGSPTTITILSDETLDVTYELRFYSPASDVTGSIVIGGVTYNYTLRTRVATSSIWAPNSSAPGTATTSLFAFNGAIGAVTASPSGTSSNSSSLSLASYSSSSYYRDLTITYGLNNGNLAGGILATVFTMNSNSGQQYQMGFDVAIPKDSTKILTFVHRFSWARH